MRPFHEDGGANRGAVEADHHQVQVGGQRVHRHHFGGLRTDHARQWFAHLLVVGHPLRVAGEMALHRLVAPFIQYLQHVRTRAAWLQPQGIAAEIDLLVVLVLRNQEVAAQRTQQVRGVKGDGVGAGKRIGHWYPVANKEKTQERLTSSMR